MNVSVGSDTEASMERHTTSRKAYDEPPAASSNKRLPMTVSRLRSLLALFRAVPVETTLLAGGPSALAAVQLANGYVNDVRPVVSIAFALVMIAFATVATDHRVAERRRRRLERDRDA
jgi:hypothetical protein